MLNTGITRFHIALRALQHLACMLLFAFLDDACALVRASEQPVEALTPVPLAGPIATLKEAQQRLSHEQQKPDPEAALLLTPPTGGPLLAVHMISATAKANPEEPRVYGTEYALALQTARGWFLLRNYGSRGRNGDLQDSIGTPKCSVETTAQIRGVQIVRCEVAYESSDRIYNGSGKPRSEQTVQAKYATWCGVGPSGVPSCTNPVPLAYKRTYAGPPVPELREQDWKLSAIVEPDGIVVTPHPALKRGYRDSEYHLLGSHRLRFP
jgi:hypothetical protein